MPSKEASSYICILDGVCALHQGGQIRLPAVTLGKGERGTRYMITTIFAYVVDQEGNFVVSYER